MTAESDLHPRRIPGAERAVADERKFTEYLLNPAHDPDKARLFAALGFGLDNWRDLRKTLLDELPRVPGVPKKPMPDGSVNWQADVELSGSEGPTQIRTAWNLKGGDPPSFITAYRARGKPERPKAE